MRTIAHLIVCMTVACLLVGCGESPRRQAAAELKAQADLAQRHYERAITLMGEARPQDAHGVPRAAPGNEQALSALRQAESIVVTALGKHADTDALVKAQAESLLAAVRDAIGDYHAAVARARILQAESALTVARQDLQAARRHAALAAFLRGISDLTPADLAAQRQAVETDIASLRGRQTVLTDNAKALQEHADALAKGNETLQDQVRDLRKHSATAAGQERVDLLKQALAIETDIADRQAQISELALQHEQTLGERAMVSEALRLAEAKLGHLQQSREGFQAATTQITSLAQRESEKLAQIQTRLNDSVADLAAQTGGAVEAVAAAVEAYDGAGQAGDRAISSMQQVTSAAAQVPQDKQNSLIIALASTNPSAAALAMRGEIALGRGSLRGELFRLAGQIERFTVDATQALRLLPLEAPQALASLAQDIGDARKLQSDAGQDFETAVKAFDDAVGKLARADKDPVKAMRGIAWTYETQKARALMGHYRLTGDAQYLQRSRQVLDEALPPNENNPHAESLRGMGALLSAQAG